jgi:predicted dehydrogenase
MSGTSLRVCISGTGFAGDFTARALGEVPHRNGVRIALEGVTSGHLGNAERFAERHGVARAFQDHRDMLESVQPHILCIACANHAHARHAIDAARAGVPVIVLEKPPLIWPGHAEGREADAATRKAESMDAMHAVLEAVEENGSRLLYAENFVYLDGVRAFTQLLRAALAQGKGSVLLQQGVCAHQGSHAPAYDTPAKSGGGALFNKACHPLGAALYLKQAEGILKGTGPVRPVEVAALALQVLKDQPEATTEHFRAMRQVDDFGRLTVRFEDGTVADIVGHDLNIGGIHNAFSVIADFGQYTLRVNPNDEHELFLPDGRVIGDLLLREKLPTPQGTSFPRPRQLHAHGYVNEMDDAVACALDPRRAPQSGGMLAWDTLAVLMAGYESSAAGGGFVDIAEYTLGREFPEAHFPRPELLGDLFTAG